MRARLDYGAGLEARVGALTGLVLARIVGRSWTVDNRRAVVFVVVVMVVVAAAAGHGNCSGNQKGEDFTHVRFSFGCF